MSLRIKKIYSKLSGADADGLLVSSSFNITYLTNYISRDSYLLISPKGNIYFTDFRYKEEAQRALRGTGITVKQADGSLFKYIAAACRNLGLRRLGFEERQMSFAAYRKLAAELGFKISLLPLHGLIEGFREAKDARELAEIKKAVSITEGALEYIRDFILPGKKEIEIAAELERFIRYHGAQSSSFGIIVASGPNSSHPHHITSERKLKATEVVLIDIGVSCQDYKSDLTRVFFLGKITPLTRRIYAIVLAAQQRAIRKIKAGASIDKIDASARGYIAGKGYAKFFGHSLGHGIGLEVHEAPKVSAKEKNKLRAGMVVTIEPGIYLPGKFGIRIEDMVLVTEKGCEVLSGALHK